MIDGVVLRFGRMGVEVGRSGAAGSGSTAPSGSRIEGRPSRTDDDAPAQRRSSVPRPRYQAMRSTCLLQSPTIRENLGKRMLDFLKQMLPLLTAALTGGFISSGVTAYLSARLEERKSVRNRRLEMVDSWRKELLHEIEANPFGAGHNGWRYSFESRPSYTTLFPMLSTQFLERVKKGFDGGRDPQADEALIRLELSSEISRIEASWKLL